MKIGIFLKDISPESGGAFTFAETVIAGLVDSGIPDRLTVFHYGSSKGLSKSLEGRLAGKVSFHCLGSGSANRFLQKIRYKLLSGFLRSLTFRLRHSFGIHLSYPSSSALDSATRISGTELVWFPTPGAETVECPYIFTVWDLEHRAQPFFPEVSAEGEWGLREKYFSKMLRRASYVITGTETGKREVCSFYGVAPERVRLLPHPTPRFALEVKGLNPLSEKLGVPTPYVFYPAQFWAHKNHVTLVKAIAVLRDRGVRVDCAFVGSNKGNRGHVEALVRELKLEDRIHFLGFVSREDLISLYQNALAMVYPSICGPENLPPLEAMALGCPVINSDIPGSREQIGSSAFLVNGLEPQEIAGAISGLLESKDRRKEWIVKGEARAKSYRDHEFVRDIAAVFDEFRKIRGLWS